MQWIGSEKKHWKNIAFTYQKAIFRPFWLPYVFPMFLERFSDVFPMFFQCFLTYVNPMFTKKKKREKKHWKNIKKTQKKKKKKIKKKKKEEKKKTSKKH